MKVLRRILAAILSAVYFVVLLVMMILFFASNVFSGNYYTEILNDTDLSEIKLIDLGVTSYSEDLGGDASVEDALVMSLEEVGIPKNDAVKIVNNEKVNEVVGTFIGDTMNYLTNNEKIPQLNAQDIKEIMQSDEVASVLEDAPTDAEIEELVNELNSSIAESLEGGVNNVE